MRKYLKLSFGLAIWAVFNTVAWSQECTPKTSYDNTATCSSEVFVARNSLELDQYGENFGLADGKYKNLRIAFNVNQETALAVHSPCSIEIRQRTSLTANSICLDARENMTLGKSFSAISSGTMKVIAQTGDINIVGRSIISTQGAELLALKQVRMRALSDITVNGGFSVSSTGTAQESSIYFGEGSSLMADSLNLSAIGRSQLGQMYFYPLKEHYK